MNRLYLFFTHGSAAKLYRTEFWMGESCFVSARGAKSNASQSEGVFQWTKGVRALSILGVITALARCDKNVAPRLEGQRPSVATWLDGVLSKEPAWVVDMFGNHINGAPAVRRLFVRSNPGGKRPGPVAVSFAPSLINGEIKIYLDGKQLVDPEQLGTLLRELFKDS